MDLTLVGHLEAILMVDLQEQVVVMDLPSIQNVQVVMEQVVVQVVTAEVISSILIVVMMIYAQVAEEREVVQYVMEEGNCESW